MLCVRYSDRSALQTPLSSYSINSTTISQHSSVMDSDISVGGTPTAGSQRFDRQPGSWNTTPVVGIDYDVQFMPHFVLLIGDVCHKVSLL